MNDHTALPTHTHTHTRTRFSKGGEWGAAHYICIALALTVAFLGLRLTVGGVPQSPIIAATSVQSAKDVLEESATLPEAFCGVWYAHRVKATGREWEEHPFPLFSASASEVRILSGTTAGELRAIARFVTLRGGNHGATQVLHMRDGSAYTASANGNTLAGRPLLRVTRIEQNGSESAVAVVTIIK